MVNCIHSLYFQNKYWFLLISLYVYCHVLLLWSHGLTLCREPGSDWGVMSGPEMMSSEPWSLPSWSEPRSQVKCEDTELQPGPHWPPPPPPIQETSGDVSGARPGTPHGALCLQITAPPYKLSRRNWGRREPIRPRPGGLDQCEASIVVTWPVSTNQRCRDGGGWTNPRPGRGIIEGEAEEAGSPLTRCLYL